MRHEVVARIHAFSCLILVSLETLYSSRASPHHLLLLSTLVTNHFIFNTWFTDAGLTIGKILFLLPKAVYKRRQPWIKVPSNSFLAMNSRNPMSTRSESPLRNQHLNTVQSDQPRLSLMDQSIQTDLILERPSSEQLSDTFPLRIEDSRSPSQQHETESDKEEYGMVIALWVTLYWHFIRENMCHMWQKRFERWQRSDGSPTNQ